MKKKELLGRLDKILHDIGELRYDAVNYKLYSTPMEDISDMVDSLHTVALMTKYYARKEYTD